MNGYLMPDLARLSSYNQRNLPEAAAVTADQETAANRVRARVRDWFAGLQARHPILALPTLVGAPPLIGDRGGRIPLTLLTMPANLAGLPALALPVPGGPASPRPCSWSARPAARSSCWASAASSRPQSRPDEGDRAGRYVEAVCFVHATESRPGGGDNGATLGSAHLLPLSCS